ncbi:MAG: exodeoxyribonuclease VII small subunit [Anaerolineae bacterium]
MNEVEKLSFEEAFKELEDTVHRLEGGGLTLDESIALFEQGMRLAKHCSQKLDDAELQVSQLVPSDEGNYKIMPFGKAEDKLFEEEDAPN